MIAPSDLQLGRNITFEKPHALQVWEAEMDHVMPLAVPQVILVPVAGLDDENLAVGHAQFRTVQLAAIRTALDENELVVRMLVPGIFEVARHPQKMEVVENRSKARSALRLVGSPESLLNYDHGRISMRVKEAIPCKCSKRYACAVKGMANLSPIC